MKVTIGISIRHVHLTEEDYKRLFDEKLTVKSYLNQPGQFASNQTVTIKNGEREFNNVRVIGPCRSYTQVEISRTDAIFLKINPPVRKSGNLDGATEITIVGPKGEITKKACIIPERHIHITEEKRRELGLNEDTYKIKITGEKGGILDNVKLSISDEAYFEMHIDSDDANAFNIKQNEEVEII